MKGFQDIVGEILFNRDDDNKEYGGGNRIIGLNCFNDGGEFKIGFHFTLGRREDDTIDLIFDPIELNLKITKTMLEAE